MPGKSEIVEMDAVTVTIGDKTWALAPARGLRGMIVVPKLISLLSEMVYGAAKAEDNLRTLIDENGINFSSIKAENLLAFKYIADVLSEHWEDIGRQIMPVLLNTDAKFLADNGTWIEHLKALNTAINFHAPYLLGDETWDGLKKSFVAPEEGEQEIQDTMMDLDENET